MKKINLTSMTRNLTAKERAKMINVYFLKEDQDDKDYSNEIKKLKSNIPYHQIPEHNFYMKILQLASFANMDLQTAYLHLELTGKQILIIDNNLLYETYHRHIKRLLKGIPKILTQQKYDKLHKKSKKDELDSVFGIESLAEHEAFAKLQSKGKINKDDYLYIFSEQLRKSRMTDKEILDEKVEQITKGIEKLNLLTKRNSSLKEVYKDYSQYLDLSPKEIRSKAKEQIDFTRLEPEVIKLWEKTVAEETKTLNKLVEKGVLKEKQVSEKSTWYGNADQKGKSGITAESWYDYSDKKDKSFNEFIDNKNQLVECNYGQVAVLNSEYSVINNKKSIAKYLKQLELIKEKDKNLELKPEIFDALTSNITKFKKMFTKGLSLIKAVNKIEKCYFDGDHILNKDNWFGKWLLKAGEEIVNNHNRIIKTIINDYNSFNTDVKEITFPKIDQIKIKLPSSVKESTLKNDIDDIIQPAIKCSGFNPPILP